MNKTVDVDFRIRAKNLSKATLSEINSDLEKLSDLQKEYASSAKLSATASKDLTQQLQYAAAAQRELTRRANLAAKFKEDQAAIKETANRLRELTQRYQEMKNLGTAGGVLFTSKDLKATETAINKTKRELDGLIVSVQKTSAQLQAVGVDTQRGEAAFTDLASAVSTSEAAYKDSVASIERYNAAVQETAAVTAEAQRRLEAEAAARRKAIGGNSLEADERQRTLAALREDIELRSKATREAEVSAEAQRRLMGEIAKESSVRERNNAAIREAVQRFEREREARAGAAAAFGPQLDARERENAVLQRSIERHERLRNVLARYYEQGIKIEAAERSRANALNQSTAAQNRNNAAVERGNHALNIFADTGRKSLSVYQRIRGQVLGMAAAYIGVYEAVNTVSKAIQATSRNQALRTGLLTVNNGDAEAAASDYEFLRKEIDRLGLVFDDVAPKFANMAIAGKSVGLTGKQIRDTFTDVASSVAAGNLSVEDSEGVFRAIVQIMGKARVQAEELRGQLGDRLPGAVAEFAKANNIALSELDDLLKKGQVGIPQLMKFIESYANRFDGQMGSITERLDAYINRARNSYNDWLRTLIAGENQTRLKAAFKAVEDFFKGDEGVKFAQDLGKAFAVVVEILTWVAQNMDKVTLALKIFLGLQAAKFVYDMGTAFVGLAKGAKVAVTAIVGVRAAAVAATGATAALTVKQRALALALGPVGIAAAAAGAALYGFLNAIEKADKETSDFLNTLDRLGSATSVGELDAGVAASAAALEKSIATMKRLEEVRKNGIGLFEAPSVMRELNLASPLTSEIDMRISQERSRQLAITQSLNVAEEKRARLMKEAEERAAKEAEEAAKLAALANAVKPPKGEKEKGPTPEELQARMEAVRRQIERASLDQQDNIARAQMDAEARTEAQLEKNHKLQLERNRIEYEDELEKMAGLQAAAQKASAEASKKGLTPIDFSAQFTQMEGQVERLRAVKDARSAEDLELGKILLKEQKINELIERRDAALQLIEAQQATGAIGVLEAYTLATQKQEEYNVQINQLSTELLALLATIDANGNLAQRLGLDELIAKLKITNAETAKLTNTQKFFRKFGEEISGGIANSFVELGKGIAGFLQGANSLGDAFKGALDSFREFAANFLQQIAQMIIQALILQAIQNAISGGSGGYGQAVGKALFGHTGGVVKSGRIGNNPNRQVPLAAFAGAQSFHTGGFPGLKTNEVAAVLKKNEEVLTEDDPRNALNGGLGGGDVNIKLVQAVDAGSIMQAGFSTAAGEKGVMAVLSARKNEIRTLLGVNR